MFASAWWLTIGDVEAKESNWKVDGEMQGAKKMYYRVTGLYWRTLALSTTKEYYNLTDFWKKRSSIEKIR